MIQRDPILDERLSYETPAASDASRVAVVIPCFNEASTIAKVVREFSAALPDAKIYVFDNNSTDRSFEEADRAGAIVIRSREQGKGNVLRHMVRVVDADIYVLTDGDDTYPAEAAGSMIEELQNDQLDMLVGMRLREYEEGAFRRYHLFGNTVISRMISLFFRTRLEDVLSGYRVLSRRFVEIVPFQARGFEVETEMTLQALNKRLRVAETPIRYRSRPEGSVSKLTTANDGLLILRSIVMLFRDYRPLVFFSTLGVVFAVCSLIAGYAPVRDYIETQYVLHVPRAILAAGLSILSLLSFTAGLILDTISRLHLETLEIMSVNTRKTR